MKRIAAASILAGLALAASSATPAQAAVTGVVYNISTISPQWITISGTWPATTTARVYGGQWRLAKGFTSGWPCYSQWGYRYSAGVWHEMHTTGALYFKCRDS